MSSYAFHLGQVISTVLGKMTMTNNMACVPKAESGTKCPKMTTPQYRYFRTSLTPQSNAKRTV